MFKFLNKFKRKQLVRSEKEKHVKMQELTVAKRQGARVKKDVKDLKTNIGTILIKPLVTEKTSSLHDASKYVFHVSPIANKTSVARAVRELYGVTVTGVNMVRSKGKRVSFGKTSGQEKDWKKAIVQLSQGEHIEIFEK